MKKPSTKKEKVAMLREWLGEVMQSSASVTVQMERASR